MALSGDVSKAWAERAEQVVERLQRSGGGWESIQVTRKHLKVTSWSPGPKAICVTSSKGAVMQANADFAPETEEGHHDHDADIGVDR